MTVRLGVASAADLDTTLVPAEQVRADLHLTSEPSREYRIRRVVITFKPGDADFLHDRMVR